MAIMLNDPKFDFDSAHTATEMRPRNTRMISVAKTDTTNGNVEVLLCFIHNENHPLNDCRAFRHKRLEDRMLLLKQHGVCFKCCAGKHLYKNCDRHVKCAECHATSHATAMHVYKTANYASDRNHDGEQGNVNRGRTEFSVGSFCTELCQNGLGKSCAKIVLVDISYYDSRSSSIRTYDIIDDQSNLSLAKPELFDHFGITSKISPYSLRSCGGKITMNGRRASGFKVASIDGTEYMELPTITECDMIPDNRSEIPTPQVAASYPHLSSVAKFIPPLDSQADILLLIGRDLMPAHYVLDQRLGGDDKPFAQRLKLGWVIICESCLDGVHIPRVGTCMKTLVLNNGRPSLFEPCDNSLESEILFATSKNDNQVGLSYAVKRTSSYLSSLHKDSLKRKHTVDFMRALLDNGHAERAPGVKPTDEIWYLPLFGVYHPKKRDKIRMVFDSSAKFGGQSLNDVLMKGPNLTNNLLGVLLRFRQQKIAVIADIQQMFYNFLVRTDHRNYLRFVWPEDNDLDNGLVDYRMNVHVFGNSPSPAVATFGLRRKVDSAEDTAGNDVKQFIERNFYVDDALSSHQSSTRAIDLLKRTQKALQNYGNLRLHKICSNSPEVLKAFNKEDLANDLKDLDFDDECPLQRSLGVSWNVQSDTFTFKVDQGAGVFTRRGIWQQSTGYTILWA